MQASAARGEAKRNMLQVSRCSSSSIHNTDSMQVFRDVVTRHGVQGLFSGILPRVGLGIWQTLFMVPHPRSRPRTLDTAAIIMAKHLLLTRFGIGHWG